MWYHAADLVENACEFDCLWHMYSAPSFQRNSGTHNHAMITDEDHIQAKQLQHHVPCWVEK
jgi:hypothetical protein